MAERRDPRETQPPNEGPVFHFDSGRPRHDHDAHVDDGPPHDDHYHVDRHGDSFGDIYGDHDDQGQHGDQGHVDHHDEHGDEGWAADSLFDRIQSLIQTLEDQLLTRQQRLERLVHERLTAVEVEASRVVRELGDHVQELHRRLDDATGDEPPAAPRPPRDPRR